MPVNAHVIARHRRGPSRNLTRWPRRARFFSRIMVISEQILRICPVNLGSDAAVPKILHCTMNDYRGVLNGDRTRADLVSQPAAHRLEAICCCVRVPKNPSSVQPQRSFVSATRARILIDSMTGSRRARQLFLTVDPCLILGR
jgi:hypothetical protein